MRRPELKLIVSCEHAGNRVPPRYRALFRGHAKVLQSHRGWDPGALELARAIAFTNHAQLLANTTTRLLVECNRSIGHAQLFSEFSRDLDTAEHLRLLATIYHPHRRRVEVAVGRALRGRMRVVHIGVHTFTPVLEGKRRRADVGLLYDPRRDFEVEVANAIARRLRLEEPRLRVRRNYPYKGWTDGLTTTLRGRFPAARYAGIEIELNQALVAKPASWKRVRRALAEAVRVLVHPPQEFL
jgi:predicted N-formylglutamate amidohydrolase